MSTPLVNSENDDPEFRSDVLAMIRADAPAYEPDAADKLVESELLPRI